jgi:ParB family chromosome partitioning protein
MKPKGGLGRGLAALLPVGDAQLRHVYVDLIVPNPRQPRTAVDADQLADLAESIRQHGVLQPLVVTEAAGAPGRPSTYQLVAGERRWQAAKIAGLDRVPVVVKEATSQQTLEWALIENIQRADLGPLEEAAAFRQLIDEFGLTQEAVADRVGRHRSSVANTLRLLRLPDSVKSLVASGALSEGHARALLAAENDAAMVRLAERAVAEGWTVRRVETEAKGRETTPPAPVDPEWTGLARRLNEALGTRTDLVRSKRGGRLVIHFYSDDELTGIVRRLGIEE